MLALLFAIPVNAEDSDYKENGIRYKLLSDNTAIVVGCDENISEITISNTLENGYNVEMIKSEAFQGNLDLETFVCNANLKCVGDYAFESCAHLTTASFKGNVEKIGNGAFSVCSSISQVELPDSVNEIGDGAFLMDRELTTFEFPSSLETLGEYAFSLSGLRKADMKCNLKHIPDRAFLKCENLSEVALPASADNIGGHAFYQCESLSRISFPENVDVIGRSAFEGCPISNISLNCSQIRERAFSGCYDLQKITLFDNLKSISSQAFANATVDKFVLPDNTQLQDGALAVVNTNGFEVHDTNEKYAVKDGVLFSKDMKTLIAYPCRDDSENSVYTVPYGVEVIAPHAFDTAWSLTEIILPDTIEEIGEYAFYQSGLRKIKLPNPVKTIKEGTFTYCQSLESVDLGNTEEINAHAFQNCGEFTLTLPDTLTDIEPLAFANSDIKLEANGKYKTVDGVLFTDDEKTLVYYPKYLQDEVYTIPEGVESISDMAFASNGSIKCINIPVSLADISEKGIGYTVNTDGEFEQISLTEGFVLIGNASEGVKNYARDNNIGVFSSNNYSQNITEATLAGNETVQFLINNTDPSDVIYTSNDDRIASVSQKGTITGIGKGTTYITAAVGMTYFKCKVTVTSDSGIAYSGFDESKYVKIDQDTYKEWESSYRANNPYLTEKFKNTNSSLAVSAYQSQFYFEAMFGADAPDSHYHDTGIAMFGEGFEKMIQALSHACDAELSRYHNTDDMLLFSGADYYTTSLVTQGKPATVSNMRLSVGTSFTYPLFTSTTLDEIVSHNFYGGQDGVLMMIYADKEALDQQHSGYIGTYHGDIEYELLMSHGAKFEVIDAGVRYISKEGFRDDNEKLDSFERYVKLKLLYDKTEPETTDEDSSDTDESSKAVVSESTDSKRSDSSVQSENTDSKKSYSSIQSESTDSKKSNSSVQSKKTESKKSNSSVQSKNTKSQNSNGSEQKNSSKVSSENKYMHKILTGDVTSHIVLVLVIVMGAAFAAVLFTGKRDS